MAKPPNQPVSPNIQWSESQATPVQRYSFLGQKGAVLWLTGLSGSGKSSVARGVEWALLENGKHAFVLDGDNVRHGLNSDLGFLAKDRVENIRRIGEVSKLFSDAHVITLVALISPYRADRAAVRALVGPDHFFEVYCAASLDVCESRDVKGLYKKARAGQIPDFTGVSAPYEAPEKPELTLYTDGREPLAESVTRVIDLLRQKAII